LLKLQALAGTNISLTRFLQFLKQLACYNDIQESLMLFPILFATLFSFSANNDTLKHKLPVYNVVANTVVNKTQLLRLVNQVRAKGCQCGDTYYYPVAPLTWNDQLEAAAQAHSNDMLSRKYFNHISPEGNNAGVRLDKAGYNWGAFGENIGMGYQDESEVVAAWKASAGHCKNLMNGKYTEMAVARAGTYWTQTFARK
jgi:uncharacterized protein YkwD